MQHEVHNSSQQKLLQRLHRLGARRHNLLQDLVDVAKDEMEGHDVPPVAAELVAHALADRIADYWGGQTIVFPRDEQWHLSRRDLLIHDQWSAGATLADLTRDTGMTERGVRKALDRIQRKLRSQARKDQPDLFG